MFRIKSTFPLVVLCLALGACGGQMSNQPRHEPLEVSSFFPDGRSSRPLVPGTVARGHLNDDTLLHTGRQSGAVAGSAGGAVAGGGAPDQAPSDLGGETAPVDGAPAQTQGGQPVTPANQDQLATVFPYPITHEILERGQSRYNIYCAPCHDRAGTGQGLIVQRGFPQPPSLHIERLQTAPVGYYYDVITHGIGTMPRYAGQVQVEDRWAIVAYIRALQLSQNARIEDVPPEYRAQLESGQTESGPLEPAQPEHGGE